ncbi:hypothetical protein BGW38_001419 [Lunasporangiospora selenospora]|uniref:Uncharacterized protein n=1 Tax=Lunasporangiospora selenospora TaxID=979761 RepID=A0A9P6KE96_9FUNG|nr:hypothetical protein BGW38_001419 [Lunasporangiospora selenospora]
MHSVARTAKARAPFGWAIVGTSSTSTSTTASSSPSGLLHSAHSLHPSRAGSTLACRSIPTKTLSCRLVSKSNTTTTTATAIATAHHRALAASFRHSWTRQHYSTQSAGSTSSSSSSGSVTIQELEQYLAKADYEGFQRACSALQQPSSTTTRSGPGAATKEVYHFLLKTLSDTPQAFAPLSSLPSTGLAAAAAAGTEASQELVKNDPVNYAIGVLTEMRLASSASSITAVGPGRQGWESAWILVDAIRHGRLPAVMSPDLWELPKLDLPLTAELWKGMFECIQEAARLGGGATTTLSSHPYKSELDTTTYLMADQLMKTGNVEMDDQLWSHVLQAYGNAGAKKKILEITPRLGPIQPTNARLFAALAEALANIGATGRAMGIVQTLFSTVEILPTLDPVLAIARQHAKKGDYGLIRESYSLCEQAAARKSADGSGEGYDPQQMAELARLFVQSGNVALDRMVRVNSTDFKNRQADVLPENVLPGMLTPPKLSVFERIEAEHLEKKTREMMDTIPSAEWTTEDYDQWMKVTTRLNLLDAQHWPVDKHAGLILDKMKQNGIKPLKSTYFSLMDCLARTRQFGPSRMNGKAFDQVERVFEEMVREGYTPKSPQDFKPLLEACCGLYSHSPFAIGQWMYTNQLYPVSLESIHKVEQMMESALGSTSDQTLDTSTTASSSSGSVDTGVENTDIHLYHDSTTLATVLAGLAFGDRLEELWSRWDELPLLGVERNATLYQTVIGASQSQEKMARYVLRHLRHDLIKEQPAIPITPALLAGLLNCCIRTEDAPTARSLIAQFSKEIQKTSEWYEPMVRACLMIDDMEEDGLTLLEEMRNREMEHSGEFYEFMMKYLVTKRGDYAGARNLFKEFIAHEKRTLTQMLAANKRRYPSTLKEDELDQDIPILQASYRELSNRVARNASPSRHQVERVPITPRTATLLNLLLMSHLRERGELLEMDRRMPSGFSEGPKERLRDAQAVVHYLVGETKTPGPIQTSTSDSVSAKAGNETPGRLVYVNKYVLGEYIEACIKEGSPEMLQEADWALNKILPRVIGESKMAKDARRLRQSFESAKAKSASSSFSSFSPAEPTTQHDHTPA